MQSKEHIINQRIGQMLHILRTFNRASQVAVAEELSISFQQLQKYEKAQNRISAAKLFMICDYFNVSPEYFYTGRHEVSHDELLGYASIISSIHKLENLEDESIDVMIELLQRIKHKGVKNTINDG